MQRPDNCEVCGLRPAWSLWDGVWLCKRGWLLKSYSATVSCRPILDDPKDDREANEALADLEQSRDAR
jgi:hypothetical protein